MKICFSKGIYLVKITFENKEIVQKRTKKKELKF
jgi:hypothetical protein